MLRNCKDFPLVFISKFCLSALLVSCQDPSSTSANLTPYCDFSGFDKKDGSAAAGSEDAATAPGNPSAIQFLKGDKQPFVLTRGGVIAKGNKTVLDFRHLVTDVNFEAGAQGFALHPRFASNGRIFVTYNPPPGLTTRLSEFKVTSNLVGLIQSERPLLEIEKQYQSHNGGNLAFGPDGYLYMSVGDGHMSNDPDNWAQNMGSLRGKVLRLDVDSKEKPYGIPKDNPKWKVEGARPEIFAVGFRNPWRFSFDRKTGDLWLGDVGDRSREEINIVKKGGNYGWHYREGTLCQFDPECHNDNFIDPVYDYGRAEGNGAIGGFVYRGKAIPWLYGHYVFSDYGPRSIFYLVLENGKVKEKRVLLDVGDRVSAFGEDDDGELYYAELHERKIKKIIPLSQKELNKPFPQKLSQTECFTDVAAFSLKDRISAYDVNLPLWSDGTTKQRFVYVPEGKKIKVYNDQEWEYPEGTVFIKNFAVAQNARSDLPLETRFLVRMKGQFLGYTYQWNDDLSDARLLHHNEIKSYDAHLDGEDQILQHYFPSRQDCRLCHNSHLHKGVLGFNAQQFNNDAKSANLKVLADQGLVDVSQYKFDTEKPTQDEFMVLAQDEKNSNLDFQARSYLHAQCAHCHNPYTYIGQLTMDLRVGTEFAKTETCDYEVKNESFSSKTRVITPGNPELSAIYLRMASADPKLRMPPVATSRVDKKGVQLIRDWILTLKHCPQ